MAQYSQQSINFIARNRISPLWNTTLNVVTLGMFYIVCRLSRDLEIRFKTHPAILSDADCVVLEDQYGNSHIVKVNRFSVKKTLLLTRYTKEGFCTTLDTCYGRFIYDYKLDKFVSPTYTPVGKKPFDTIYQEYMLKTREEESIENYEKSIIFGSNDLGLKIPSVSHIIFNELLDPLFLWEVASFAIWISIKYYRYVCVVGPIFLMMFFIKLFRKLANRNALMRNTKRSRVRILREGIFQQLPEQQVLPGDIVYIDVTETFACDVEILKGNVITDESFLTGESVPVCKGPEAVVYSGTKVIKSTSTQEIQHSTRMEKLVRVKNLTRHTIQTGDLPMTKYDKIEDLAIGIVIKTGKKTKRGILFKNLAIKRPSTNEFNVQSLCVLKKFAALSVLLLITFMAYLSYRKVPIDETLRYSIDVCLTFCSPALYTSLEMGAQYIQGQLLKKNIHSTDITRINTAGVVDLVVFDKTGTLTELGVDIHCFDTGIKRLESIEEIDLVSRMALSTCHYVVELDNQYSGDIVDMKMFMFSQSKIVNKDGRRMVEMEVSNKYRPVCKEYSSRDDDCTLFFNAETNSSSSTQECMEDMLEVLKIYDFDLYLKRISVVVQAHDGRQYLFSKGAPDSMWGILGKVPTWYNEKVRDYGLEGYRVLTVGYREITEYGRREADESGLEFLGFLVLANRLKEETVDVVRELREAELRPKMCTGDNILTAISVAKECGMIDGSMPVLFPVIEEGTKTVYDVDWFCVAEDDYVFDKWKMQLYYESNRTTTSEFVVAIEGKEFEFFKESNYHEFILEKGVVFARFNPENKKSLIEEYSREGRVTMFCGDGANDTGALCSADVGVSLAKNETCLAASFNSHSLTAVLEVVKEGRSALSMSAAQFKYIFYAQVLAGFQMLPLLSQLLFPSDEMSLVNDLMSCYVLAYALSNFKAAKKIHPKKIDVDLTVEAFYLFLELVAILLVFSVTSFSIVKNTQTELSVDGLLDESQIKTKSNHSMVIFICTMALLVYRSLKFADFGPHRQSYKKNPLFLCIFGLSATCSVVIGYLLITGHSKTLHEFDVIDLNYGEKIKCFMCLAASFLITVIADRFEHRRRKMKKQA